MNSTRVVTCHRCGQSKRDYSRGLCHACHTFVVRHDLLDDYPRQWRTRDEVLDEWVILRPQGYTRRLAAERLGMKPEAFIRALQRARRDGDPRARRDIVQREYELTHRMVS